MALTQLSHTLHYSRKIFSTVHFSTEPVGRAIKDNEGNHAKHQDSFAGETNVTHIT